MKYFDVFTGVGGFSLGMPKEFECVGMSEIDPYCNMVLKYRFPHVINYGDITKFDYKQLPSFDLLIGGSPCQGFSVAGQREGLSDPRSGLLTHYTWMLCEKQPRYFIWENVENTLCNRKGMDFKVAINLMADAGYSLKWQVFNAKDFGLPLQRQRIFVVGCLGEWSRPETLYFAKDDGVSEQECGSSLPVLTATDYKGPSKQRAKIVVADDNGLRKFTPLERERMMSWPDDWTRYGINEKGKEVEISDTQRCMMTGNGVVSRIVKYIVENYINEQEQERLRNS